jgi:hypothetical protein
MTEREQFGNALAAWLTSQDVSPGIAAPMLVEIAGRVIGLQARKGDVEDFSTGLATIQHLLQYSALETWVRK